MLPDQYLDKYDLDNGGLLNYDSPRVLSKRQSKSRMISADEKQCESHPTSCHTNRIQKNVGNEGDGRWKRRDLLRDTGGFSNSSILCNNFCRSASVVVKTLLHKAAK